jgi:hypothetical protein
MGKAFRIVSFILSESYTKVVTFMAILSLNGNVFFIDSCYSCALVNDARYRGRACLSRITVVLFHLESVYGCCSSRAFKRFFIIIDNRSSVHCRKFCE